MNDRDVESRLEALGRDLELADGARIMTGIVIVVAAILMVVAAWPTPDLVRLGIVVVMAALPTALYGAGMVAKELSRAHEERLRRLRADEGDVAQIRSAIAEERSLPEAGAGPEAGDDPARVEPESPCT